MSRLPREIGPEQDNEAQTQIDRRRFLTSGAAAGVAATAALPVQPADGIGWDREVDVVVIGAGAGGLPAAIAAREKGASVLIVEQNFDIGGRAMMSFGGLYIGGGNRMQKAIGVQDSPDQVFADWTRPEKPMGRFSDRELGAHLGQHGICRAATFGPASTPQRRKGRLRPNPCNGLPCSGAPSPRSGELAISPPRFGG